MLLVDSFEQVIWIKDPDFFVAGVEPTNEDGVLPADAEGRPPPVLQDAVERLDRVLRDEDVVGHVIDHRVGDAVAVPEVIRADVEHRVGASALVRVR